MDISYINWTLIATLAGLGAGYWLRGQTVSTIEADITAIKNELSNLKNLFTPVPVVAVAPLTPPAAV